MRIFTLLSFLPEEAYVFLIVAAGFAIMFGGKKIAAGIFTMLGLLIVLPIVLEPLFDMLPEWALTLIVIFFIISIPLIILRFIMGERAWTQFVANISTNIVTWLFLLPFRLLRNLFRRPGR